MKSLLKILGGIVVILLLNFLINLLFVSKNKGKDFVETYIKESKKIRIRVDSKDFSGKFTHVSYFKGTVFFKGLYGNSQDEIVLDNINHKYYRIMRFDPYGDKFSYAQTYKIDNKELIVKVDPLQYNDKTFGTKENPILVFWYKGANEKLIMNMDIDELDEDGVYKQAPTLISPTEEEYRYNVTQYLTYVMPKEEFKKRFK
ncbi:MULTISPECIES: hypothetical protein [Empedobacter]|uniref:DUF8188 domain-containing protein n=2 Tax=Empedobacter falsenii TaxID=343874 RepID=A0A7H9DVS8_9FLAO|nr:MULTISPECIES: hypothetical protein [Empedobacter]MDH2205907.1 hypothetical protein [Empedobacter sp. GD03644]QLL58801.1 hypothetical protein FH779_12165 [Empedobacter falsenii]